MILIGKARQGVIGLRLQIDRVDALLCLGAQLRHPASVQQIGNQPCDKHGLARPAEARHPKPQHRIKEYPRNRSTCAVDLPRNSVGYSRKHRRPLYVALNIGSAGGNG